MKRPKLILCDIDGTLVPKHQYLTENAKKVIKELKKQGVYFGIASGRPLYQINYSISEWGCDEFDVLIGLNGSALWDGIDNKEYNYYVMKKEWIKETIELMSKFECNPSIYRDNFQLFLKEDATMRMYAEMGGMDVQLVKNIEDLYSEDTAKIMFRVTEDIMPQAEKWVNEHPTPYYTGCKTCADLIEFNDSRVNKSYALKKFCEMHNIGLDEVVSFGDTSNDNDMLKVSGLGVCMLNGTDDTKQVADIISEKECDDDGWADFMNQHIMPIL